LNTKAVPTAIIVKEVAPEKDPGASGRRKLAAFAFLYLSLASAALAQISPGPISRAHDFPRIDLFTLRANASEYERVMRDTPGGNFFSCSIIPTLESEPKDSSPSHAPTATLGRMGRLR